MKETVDCAHGPACGSLGPDHHGWDCPLSDPHGDVLRALMDPLTNPLLDSVRRDILRHWTPEEYR